MIFRPWSLQGSQPVGHPVAVPDTLDTYVSGYCRDGQHKPCQEGPPVLCACECHEGQWSWVERRIKSDDNPVRRRKGDGPLAE